MKKQQTSYAFLMEMMWVCGFFAIASCIFVLAFVKADRLSKNAENLNQAVLLAQNAVESYFSEYEAPSGTPGPERADDTPSGGTGSTFYDDSWTLVDTAEQAVYSLSVSSREDEGLLVVTAAVSKKDGDTIYQLEGSIFPSAKEGRLP